MKYTVMVDDNFHYMDESERYTAGEFETADEAIAVAKKIVDDFLDTARTECQQKLESGERVTAEELHSQYCGFGEDPFIVSEDKSVTFSAWTYAEQRCEEIIREAADT